MIADAAHVESLLRDIDPEARRRAAQLLPGILGPEAVALLVRALGDEDWRVRKEAAAASTSVEPREAVLTGLFDALSDRDNVGLRNASIEALMRIGRDAVPRAVEALRTADADARKLLVEVLGSVPDLAGTVALTRAIADPDVNVRVAAAEALASSGLAGDEARRLAVAGLVTLLAAQETLERLSALNALGKLEARLPWSVCEPLTRDPMLRRHAIIAASRSGDPGAVAALASAIGDPQIAVSRDAIIALVDCLRAEASGEDLRAVARGVLDGSETARRSVRGFAANVDDRQARGAALVILGLLQVPTDVPEIVRGLSDDDVAQQAEQGLRWFGTEAVPALLVEGKRSLPPLRAATLSVLPTLIEQADETTLLALREALDAPSAEVRIAALQAIAHAGCGADLAVLAEHATSPDPRVAAAASLGLTSLARRHVALARRLAEGVPPDAPNAVVGCLLRGATAHAPGPLEGTSEALDLVFLRGALDHDDTFVRRAAVDALASIGGPHAAVVTARALADEERDVVLTAVRALGHMGQTDHLLGLLSGVKDAVVISATLRALCEASPADAFLVAGPLLTSEDPLLASSAALAIGQLRGARRDEGLFVALEHADADVVKSALVELARDMSERSRARIGLCLDHPAYEVRRFAAELLGSEDDPVAAALMRARLDRETDPVVREALHLALAPRAAKEDP